MSVKSKKWLGAALLVGTLVAVGVWLMLPRDAGALPPFSRLTDYYSDATFTNYTGACFRNCAGGQECEPDVQKTQYFVQELDYACIGSGYCCIRCMAQGTRISCPQNVLNNYPCPTECGGG